MEYNGMEINPDIGTNGGFPYCRCNRTDGNCPRFYDGARCEITRETVLKELLCRPAVKLMVEENARLKENLQDLLDANHTLSAEIDRLKGSINFLTREIKDMAGRLGKELADGMSRLDDIERLRAEIDRLTGHHG
jgi:predicted nuclease with TOPRIM domain